MPEPEVMRALTIPCEVISPGVTEGQLSILRGSGEFPLPKRSNPPVDPGAELENFHQQVAALGENLRQVVTRLEAEGLSAEADIVRAHLMMLGDPKFQGRIEDLVRRTGLAARRAVANVVQEMLHVFGRMNDPVLAERAADLKDLAMQLEERLEQGRPHEMREMLAHAQHPVVAIRELLPSVVLEARALHVQGLIVERGTRFSHGAILARALGMPAVRVAGLEVLEGNEGRRVLVDADRGELLIDPDAAQRRERMQAEAVPAEPAAGQSMGVRLWVSIVDPAQLEDLDWRRVEGVGLYRTETIFMAHREDFPSEDEQLRVYRRLFELCGQRPVTIRTADLGGDKAVSYLSMSREDNPYLGLRAHRLCRFLPELLIVQVRAILRAGHGGHNVRIMYPMVESVDQWRFIQTLVAEAVDSLRAEGLVFQERFSQGVLVETPSAVWDFSGLLAHADFAAIGTNDLVQYMFAVDRNNANVTNLYQPEHPIVLRVLRHLVGQARKAGKEISLCGEVARNTRLLPLLVGLGLRDLTVSKRSLAAVGKALRTLRMAECRRVAKCCLRADSVEQVGACLGGAPARQGEQVHAGQAIDPVCRMTVRRIGNPHLLTLDGVTYYFCSVRCRRRFAARKGVLAE
jgi:phosphoenolpyruvate-protein phosphotransferase